MSWAYLCLAIAFEVSGTTCMKLSQGFTRLGPTIGMVIFYSLSFSMLTLVLKKMEVSVAYAVWSGLGTSLIAIIGIVWFREPATILKLFSLGLIVAGVVGLNLGGSHH